MAYSHPWGCAQIGMMEYRNIGIMGFGILSGWTNRTSRISGKIKIARILIKPNIPSFHHSNIPLSSLLQN
jgi:hypothetical protein